MTLVVSLALQNAFIFGSESRQILAGDDFLKSISEGDYSNRNFEIQQGEFPKTFLIGERYGLNYSGSGFVCGWSFDDEIQELQQMATDKQSTLYDLANHLNNKLKCALKGQPFTFFMAGFPGGLPMMVASNDGELAFYKGRNIIMGTGWVDIAGKILKDETIDYEHMTIKDAVEFVWLTITAGCKYLEYFTRYPNVSGGPIKILIITPYKCGFLKYPSLDILLQEGGLPV